jgi:UrcA family protein
MTTFGRLIVGTAVGVILASASAYADSAPNSAPSSLSVRIADLNLAQPRDVARLYTRISKAADQVCGPRSVGGFNLTSTDYRTCYADAIEQAVAHLDRPVVTAYYRERLVESAPRNADLALQ